MPMFWSGRVGNGSILPFAEICAGRLGARTIGMMMCDLRGFVMPSDNAPPVPSRDLWNYASKTFAVHTKGRADVMLGDSVNPHGTWTDVELPALKVNPNVNVVVQVNRATCKDMCYWYCRSPIYCWPLSPCRPLTHLADEPEAAEETLYLAQVGKLVSFLVN